ncbi:MAG: flagellar basal body P-ring formation chaperone FlgA, partial [Acidobacteriota bacterium]|nr:flagellar basal body P-ring formation chaperone FlgA [Acidobacteriota bacterium]
YDHGRSMAIWAKVKVLVESSVVTAIANISSGRVIESDQVSIVLTKQFPVPSDVLKNVDQVVGKRARRSIQAGSPIRANLLEAPREIGQGDVVQVSVVDGQAQITFQSRAQSGGRKGDTILVQNPSNGRSFKATIIDKAKVEVRPSGA